MLKWSFQELLCTCPCLGGQTEQVGVEAPESWAECERVGWPWGGRQQGQSCSDWSRFSSVTGQGLKVQRQDYAVGMVPHGGVGGISVTLLLPSHPLYCCATEGLTSWSFLWPGETSIFLKHRPKSRHAALSVVAFRLEFVCCECTFF